MTAIQVTSWSDDGQARIDLFWRDHDLGISHIGGDGVKWSGNRIGPLGFVVPEYPDALGGIHITTPAVATALVQIPEPVNPGHPPTPPHPPWLPPVVPPGAHVAAAAAPVAATSGQAMAPTAAAAPAPHPPIVHPPVVHPTAHRMDVFGIGLVFPLSHQLIRTG